MDFSERYGHNPVRDTFQAESMDDALRIGLWNALDLFCFEQGLRGDAFYIGNETQRLCEVIWMNFLKEPRDEIPDECCLIYDALKDRYFDFEWHEVYSFLEFVVAHDPNLSGEEFGPFCNSILEREMSAYRFVGKQIVPITDQVEIDAIEEALDQTSAIEGVKAHLDSALALLSDREKPNYRKSIDESITAVEGIAQLIVGDPKATLGEALNRIEKAQTVALHPALKEAFSKLYGYTSDADGIRHALSDVSTLTFDDAKFMLVSCSAFVNYLIAKSQEAGIALAPDK